MLNAQKPSVQNSVPHGGAVWRRPDPPFKGRPARRVVGAVSGYYHGTVKMLASSYRRAVRYFGRLERGFRIGRAMGIAGTEEFTRVGLFEKKDERSALSVVARAAYRIYLATVFVAALLLAHWAAPIDGVPYFAALLALSAAWLFALPSICDSIAAIDFSTIQFGSRAFEGLVARIRAGGIDIPTAFSDEEKREMDRTLPPIVSGAFPIALLDVLFRLTPGAVLTGAVGLVGLLIGPKLQTVQWWHGWSPASILFALPAPWALLLLASLLFPISAHVYLAARRYHDLPIYEVPGKERAKPSSHTSPNADGVKASDQEPSAGRKPS